MYSQLFSWNNYEENPQNAIGVETIPTQKEATYNEVAEGVFTGNMEESFFTNEDKTSIPNVATVIGEKPGAIIEGKGVVLNEE